MRALPYGVPKVMVSTVASGDTSSYVGISDITMMFSVGDILGLSPRTVTKHLEHVFEKLGVETRTAAAGLAIGRVRQLG